MTISKKMLAAAFGGTLLLGTAIGVAVADQPFMHSALRDLREAKRELESGSDDHGGHRVAAIRATDDAIREVQDGIEWARHH